MIPIGVVASSMPKLGAPNAPVITFTDTYVGSEEVSGGSNEPNITIYFRTFDISLTTPSNNGSAITGAILEASYNNGSTWQTNAIFEPYITTNSTSVYQPGYGETYLVRYRAVNAIGQGAPSNSLKIQYSLSDAGTAGLVPNQTVITGISQTGNNNLLITWNTPTANGAPLEYFRLESSTDGVNYSAHVPDGNISGGATALGVSVSTDITYYFRIAATNAYGRGTYSTPVTGYAQSGLNWD